MSAGNPLRERVLNGIGLGLLVVCFVAALGRILWKQFAPSQAGEKEKVIRFAHWQLEGGVREGFDAVAAEYMRRHPGVKVMQIPVPERTFQNWLVTQLVGGTAPDLIEMGMGMTDEHHARYFRPVSDIVNSPNPWNKGTSLENTPLRETFIDGLESGFSPTLLEYYGLPVSAFSLRMFYNLDLLKEITGAEKLPATYRELVALARQTREYSERTGRDITPVSGSRTYAPIILRRLFGSQTEQLSSRIAYDFLATGPDSPNAALLSDGYLDGKWSLENPEIVAGLELMRDLSQYMQPGFLQLGRDDAAFYFVQGHALMMATGSWDATSITTQAGFRIGISHIPVPAPGDPMGPFSLGPISDSGAAAGLVMGLTRQSAHPEIALDFLRFLASQPMNQRFSDVSKWAPSVVGVIPSSQAKIFQPFLDGFLGGVRLDFSGADSKRVVSTAYNRLMGAAGSTPAFLEVIKFAYSAALLEDLNRQTLTSRMNAQRTDTTLGALAWMHGQNPADASVSARLDLLLQAAANTDHTAWQTARARARVQAAQSPK